MPGYEVLDLKAARKATRDYLRGLDRSDKKKNLYFGAIGDDLYHFSEDRGHATEFAMETPDKRVVEGVLLSNALLKLDDIPPKPQVPIRKDVYFRDKEASTKTHEEAEKMWQEHQVEVEREKQKYIAEVKPYKDWFEANRDKAPYFLQGDKAKYSSTYRMNLVDTAKAMWVDSIVNKIASEYQRIHGVPMPQDICFDKKDSEKFPSFYKEHPEMNENYNRLRHDIYYDKYVMKRDVPQAYLVLKSKLFQSVFKKAGFDAVSYRDTVSMGDDMGKVSYGVTKPNQFKAYAGNKPVNLKSKNMFDAD